MYERKKKQGLRGTVIDKEDSSVTEKDDDEEDALMADLEAHFGGMNGSKSTKKVKARNPMPHLVKKRLEKPGPYKRQEINTGGIKFEKLTFGTLRRY